MFYIYYLISIISDTSGFVKSVLGWGQGFPKVG